MRHFFSRFFYVIQGRYKTLAFMLSLFLLTSFLEVFGVGMVGPFISLATKPNEIQRNPWMLAIYKKLNLTSDYQFLLITGLAIISIFYIKSFFTFTAQKRIFEFGFSQEADLSYRLIQAYLAAPYTFHLSRNTATITQNIINETQQFSNSLMMPMLTSISNAFVTLALVGLLMTINMLAMVIIAIVVLVAFAIVQALRNRLRRWGEDGSDARTKIIRTINHSLGGLKETKIIGCESYFETQLEEQVERYGTSTAKAVSFSNLPRYMIESLLITFLVIFTVFFFTSNKGSSQDLTSVLGIFALASIRLLPATSGIATSINIIRSNLVSLDKIYVDFKSLEGASRQKLESVDLNANIKFNGNNRVVAFREDVVLENLAYHYPNAQTNSLDDISLAIRRGESIGLIGKSGAGKTTLVDVILGLLIPQSGDIKVDGASIYGEVRAWQNIVGYVPQSIFLIDGSLKQNIAFGVLDRLIDEERLMRALEMAQLSELLEQLPHGLETEVGERGILLSGGQRQRVGIARALYHEREILVFDEATAALDNETEALVTEAIKSLSGAKTMIIIAHRLSTLEHCDRIYMLEKGKIVRSGTYREVVSMQL